MKRYIKLLWVVPLVLVAIQFIRPDKNTSATPSGTAVATVRPVPEELQTILAKACNDCHSNNSRYPWYNQIQPVAWWLNRHITEGKHHLNFDEFATYSPRRQYGKLKGIEKLVHDDKMPLPSYTWIHKDAILTDHEKEVVGQWCRDFRQSMEAQYPMDSLVKPKSEVKE